MAKNYSRRSRLSFGIFMGVLAQLSAIGLLLTGSWLIVRAAEQPPVLHLMVAIVAVRFFGISRSVFRYVERLATHDVALADAVEQRVETYVDVDRLAPAGFGRLRRGDLVSRVVADVARLPDKLLRIQIPWVTGLAASAVVVIVIAAINRWSGLVILTGVVVSALALRTAVSATGMARAGQVEAQGRLSSEVSTSVLAARELVAFGAAEPVRERARSANADASSAQLGGAGTGGLGAAVVLAITGTMVAVLAATSSGIDPVAVGVILLAPIALAEPMDGLAEAERVRPLVSAATDRLAALASAPPPVEEPESPAALPQSYELELVDLVAGWNRTATTKPVSFTLAEGGSIALTGASGSGKSTMAYTLLRLLSPVDGEVKLGSVPIEQLASAEVRSVLGYLGQDDMVFDTTIRENLRIADPAATDERLLGALQQSGLGDTVAVLPAGLDTEVGEHGSRLSGGERQRLCLARLLLGDHRILLLDEPTEHLDPQTADALLDDVIALAKADRRSLIVISHSAPVLARFEHVISLT